MRELWKHKFWFVFLDLLAFLEYLTSLIRYRIFNHFGAHHLSVSQVSVKWNIRRNTSHMHEPITVMRVFPQFFRVLPNFHECFYNSKETQRTCFLLLLENTVARKRTTTCQLWWSKCKFILLVTIFKKNTILVWNLLRIIVSTLGAVVCQASKVFFNAKRAFVDDTRIIKIYAMAEWPRMFRNVWSIFFPSSFPWKEIFYIFDIPVHVTQVFLLRCHFFYVFP